MIILPKDIDQKKLINKLKEINLQILFLLKSYNQNQKNKNEYQKKLKIVNDISGPVTEADIRVNNFIISELLNYCNLWEIVSEENSKKEKIVSLESDWVWIIDPLDGTKDFIQNTGEYAVHIALSYKKKIILGSVLIPLKNELWFFMNGIGTWYESIDGNKNLAIQTNKKDFSEMTILISRNHCPANLESLLVHLKPKKIQGMGSVGYKVSSILKGEGDLYISYSEPGGTTPKDWDMAAPLAIIKGAGGYLTNEYGQELKFLENNKFKQEEIMIIMSANLIKVELYIKSISN